MRVSCSTKAIRASPGKIVKRQVNGRVKRGRTEIERDVANYTIVEHDGVIFACAALYPYPEAKTGEMAALTVSA